MGISPQVFCGEFRLFPAFCGEFRLLWLPCLLLPRFNWRTSGGTFGGICPPVARSDCVLAVIQLTPPPNLIARRGRRRASRTASPTRRSTLRRLFMSAGAASASHEPEPAAEPPLVFVLGNCNICETVGAFLTASDLHSLSCAHWWLSADLHWYLQGAVDTPSSGGVVADTPVPAG